jgi:hypothetical protein
VAQKPTSARTKTEQPAPTARRAGRGRGGKSRDPAWRQHTVLLEKETHLTALDLLRRHYEGQDLSDLLNRLLKEWVQRHQRS